MASIWSQIGSDIYGEAANDHSGSSIALSADGSVIAIGAYRNDSFLNAGGTDCGHVRIFQNNNGIWSQVGSDIDGDDRYGQSGQSVSLSSDGNVVAIGSPYNDSNGELEQATGKVRIYKNVNNNWTQVGNDINGESKHDFAGCSISISNDGNVIAVAAKGHDGGGTDSGHVRIYKNNGGIWTQIGSDIDGEDADDYSGYAVSLSGDGNRVAITAPYNNYTGNYDGLGHVRIFENIDSKWIQIGNDIDGKERSENIGRSVSISENGDFLAFSSYLDFGIVRVYQEINNAWVQVGSDINGEYYYEQYGSGAHRTYVSISNDGNAIAIGSPENDNDNGTNSGHVRIFENINNNWTKVGNTINGDYYTYSGESVSLVKNAASYHVAIGAPYDSSNGSLSGHVRVYEIINLLITAPSGSIGDATSSNSVKENSTDVHTFTANESVTWSLSGGADLSKFSIDTSSGALTFDSAPDYESPGDSDRSNDYVVTVRATDSAGNTSDQTLTVSVDDIDEINPTVRTITSSTADASYKVGDSISISVAFSESVDVDTTGGTPTLELETGSNNRSATYSSGSGSSVLSFTYNVQEGDTSSHLDYASTSALSLNSGTIKDSAGNNATVTLPTVAGLSSLSGTSTLIIDTTTPTIRSSYGTDNDSTGSKSISENETTVHTFEANETVIWSISGGADASKFSIDSSTGALTFSSAPNYESPTDSDNNNDYIVTIRATDLAGNISDQELMVSIDDDSDETLLIQGPSGDPGDSDSATTIVENNTTVYTFSSNESNTWFIDSGLDDFLFVINSTSGELSFKKAPSYENKLDSNSDNIYQVKIKAIDRSGELSTQDISVSISDVYESNDGSGSFSIFGSQNIGDYLSVKRDSLDPNGTGILAYQWQSSRSSNSWSTWTNIGSDSSYRLKLNNLDKYIRATITYSDHDGYSESVTTSPIQITDNPLSNSYFSNLGYTEEFGTSGNDSLSSSANKIVWGLTGSDTLTNSYSSYDQYLLGGSGDDTYTVKSGSTALIYEAPNHGYDKLYLNSSYSSGYAATIDNKHIVAIENSWSDQGVIILNAWDQNIEEIHLAGAAYSTSYFLSILPSMPGYLGNVSFDDLKPYLGDIFVDSVKSGLEVFKSSVTTLETKANNLNYSTEEVAHSNQNIGSTYHLTAVRDYDGNFHANTGRVSDATKSAYKYQGLLDVNADGVKEAIYTNKESGRWVTASVDSITGQIDYSDHGSGGTTRVVGIYIDPLVTSGEVVQFGPHDSQRRFQNDLKIDNLIAKTSGDYDGDGFQEVYWKTNDGTAYLRALMHADGNIQYANYQSEAQMTTYLTNNGHSSVVSEVV